jgi:hypothetical protein
MIELGKSQTNMDKLTLRVATSKKCSNEREDPHKSFEMIASTHFHFALSDGYLLAPWLSRWPL